MNIAALIRVLAYASTALLLLVVGAALRPVFVTDTASAPSVLDDTEISFVQDMTAHHEQAVIIVSDLAADADAAVRRLAEQIEAGQRTELGMMLGWLRLARVPVTNPHPMAWMQSSPDEMTHHDHSGAVDPDTTTAMPGMATRADLDSHSAAHGSEASIIFLTLMQRHHVGGIAMAQAADHELTDGPVKAAARDMISTQNQEAAAMELLLAELSPPR